MNGCRFTGRVRGDWDVSGTRREECKANSPRLPLSVHHTLSVRDVPGRERPHPMAVACSPGGVGFGPTPMLCARTRRRSLKASHVLLSQGSGDAPAGEGRRGGRKMGGVGENLRIGCNPRGLHAGAVCMHLALVENFASQQT